MSPPHYAASFEGKTALHHLAPQFRFRLRRGQSVQLVRRGVKRRKRRFLAATRGRINAKRKKSRDASRTLLNTEPLLRHRFVLNSDLIGQELKRKFKPISLLLKNSPSCGMPTRC
ncbi:hypothetical protein AVEN_204058-1 [Araneus ventricosus]|uniref:Uncharacterized protein n=1 Tax=Araneus ventricosus TaxID=182803 RepID=A0A4Y2G0Y1_ARAVE|nr:hypothetical protein AVEN_204058-1 [Araneus ventricosus]